MASAHVMRGKAGMSMPFSSLNRWRYNPALGEEGKNPFQLDSKEPAWDKFQDFLEGEVRFLSLKKAAPQEAQELFDACKEAAQRRYKSYIRKTQEDWSL